MAVRFPRVEWAIGQVEKEQRWLPKLAPLLPLSVPVPLAMGGLDEGYPWRWSVYRWLDGENATVGRIDSPRQATVALAQFVASMQRIDPAGGRPQERITLAGACPWQCETQPSGKQSQP
jgi:aminoglycoside phosphotransferase (APT) family kinase protein